MRNVVTNVSVFNVDKSCECSVKGIDVMFVYTLTMYILSGAKKRKNLKTDGRSSKRIRCVRDSRLYQVDFEDCANPYMSLHLFRTLYRVIHDI